MKILYIIILGVIIGALWFRYGERSNKSKFSMECWEKLHYLNKERSPLIIVHLKSVLAGIFLIILANTKYKYRNEIITIIGSTIIGLHVAQYINENNYINNPLEKFIDFF